MTQNFRPCLYTFSLPEDVEQNDEVAPPLWALLDHVIAVAHYLNSPNNNNLDPDVTQLKWVLGFITSQNIDLTKYKYLNCLKNSLQVIIHSKMRSFLDNVQHPKETNKCEINNLMKEMKEHGEKRNEVEELTIPITLLDILSQQPKNLKLRFKDKTEELPKMKCVPVNLMKTIGYQECSKLPMSEKDCRNYNKREEIMSMNKQDLAQYLHALKEHQNEILQQEQKHLDMLDSIINQMN